MSSITTRLSDLQAGDICILEHKNMIALVVSSLQRKTDRKMYDVKFLISKSGDNEPRIHEVYSYTVSGIIEIIRRQKTPETN